MDGLGVLDKAPKQSSSSTSGGGGGGAFNLQRIESSFPWKMTTLHHCNHHRPFSFGPTWNSGGNIELEQDDVGDFSPSGGAVDSGGAVGVRTLQQPFHTAFRSPGGMAATMGFPFTNAQWKELKRQALIYQYILASVPVPPDLLLPFPRNASDPALSLSHFGGGGFSVRYSNGVDPEPGRCRRTDGKKWRCSRDVAPHHKYCERHMHRGRPRSRKPVELPPVKKTRHNHPVVSSSPVSESLSAPTIDSTSAFLDKSSDRAAPFESLVGSSLYEDPRSSDWLMRGDSVPTATADQQWNHLMPQTKLGLSSESSFDDITNTAVLSHQYEEELLNLNAYSKFSSAEDQQRTFLKSGVVSPEKIQRENGIDFIDAWSNGLSDNPNMNLGTKTCVFPDGNLSLSSLNLSMGGNNYADEEMDQIQMCSGVIESDQNNERSAKPHLSNWVASASWAASTPGGPLAEVLGGSSVSVVASASLYSLFPITGNEVSDSPAATLVSSPSGVLQKTPVSLSDSSDSSSLIESRLNPDINLMRAN